MNIESLGSFNGKEYSVKSTLSALFLRVRYDSDMFRKNKNHNSQTVSADNGMNYLFSNIFI